MYEQHTPEFTFSKIVQSMPAKPETKTASTQYSAKDAEITESSKVIISRISKQKQNNQNATSSKSSSEKPTAQKQQNQTNSIAKQTKQKVISDRMKKGSDDPIQNHNKFGPLADDGVMDTDEGTMRSGDRGSRPRSPVKAPK